MQPDMSLVFGSVALHNSLYKYANTAEPQLKVRTAVKSANKGRYIRYTSFEDLSGIKYPPMSFKIYARAKCSISTAEVSDLTTLHILLPKGNGLSGMGVGDESKNAFMQLKQKKMEKTGDPAQTYHHFTARQ
ncbi:actin-depolymerizing factor [Senna tora]|uniref:Actin-depolymerizing factor n=1 Tax=Senna tora TaxID=362788 RepID=A0A834WGF6_9FABA|nr:actin-depolymerizing factor [Senna tora]